MRIRILAVAAAALFTQSALAARTHVVAPPLSGVVISEIVTRGSSGTGASDEYVEILNNSKENVVIGGWQLQGCQSGTPGTPSTRATVPAGIALQPGQHYLFVNGTSGTGYSLSVPGDQTYSTGFTDFAASNFSGARIVDASSVVQDGVGSAQSPCREGTGIVTPGSAGPSNAARRKLDETMDSGDNASDFDLMQTPDPDNFAGTTTPPVQNDRRIYEIQGAGHVSPFNGQKVTNVPGIVTQVRSNGFTMQDGDGDGDPGTSDGIFVFTNSAPTVTVGQEVKVDATVQEFRSGSTFSATNCPSSSGACNLTVTELGGPTVTVASNLFANNTITPTVIGTGGRVPPSAVIDDDTNGSVEVPAQTTYDPAHDGIDFYESVEGMLVQLNNVRAVGPTNSFEEIWVVGDDGANATGVNARGGVTITENAGVVDFNPERILVDVSALSSDFPVNVGDTAPSVVGTLSYDFGDFRVLPSSLPAFADNGLKPTVSSVSVDSSRLRIASYNVENLDANDADTCDGGPDKDVADGRFTNEAKQIVQNLGAPDVIGIEELQDNSGCTDDGTVSSTTTLDTLIGAIHDAGGPTYAYTLIDPVDDADGGVPGGNIRQGILYDASRLTLVPGTMGAGDSTTATQVVAGADGSLQLTLSPGRVQPADAAWNASRKPLAATFDFNGRRILLIVNHFNSKGGDEPLFGRFQPPVLTSEAQRLQQAQLEHDFVQSALGVDPQARIVALGDFNDFAFSAPLKRLTGREIGSPILFDLADELLTPEERYSYVFEGNSQELDHLLVSAALLPSAQVQPIHINAEFANQVSDHDPAIASLLVGADGLPDAFAFDYVRGAAPSTLVTSNTVTLTGFSQPLRIVFATGEYSLNSGPFTTKNGTVKSGDTLQLRTTSPATGGTSVLASVRIGTTSVLRVPFRVTTLLDVTPDAFDLGSVIGAQPGTLVESQVVTVGGFDQPLPIAVDAAGEYRINGGAYTSAVGMVSPNDTVQVRMFSSTKPRARVRTLLRIGKTGRGYFTVSTAR